MGTLNLGRRFAPLVYLEGIISPWKRNWASNNMVFIFESAHDCEVCIVKCFGGSCCQPFWDVIISALHCSFCYWVFVQARFFSSVLVCSKLIFQWQQHDGEVTMDISPTFLNKQRRLLFCTSFPCLRTRAFFRCFNLDGVPWHWNNIRLPELRESPLVGLPRNHSTKKVCVFFGCRWSSLAIDINLIQKLLSVVNVHCKFGHWIEAQN